MDSQTISPSTDIGQLFNEDPGLRQVECATCRRLECAANLVFCFICDDAPDVCIDCLTTHEQSTHTKEEIVAFFREVAAW